MSVRCARTSSLLCFFHPGWLKLSLCDGGRYVAVRAPKLLRVRQSWFTPFYLMSMSCGSKEAEPSGPLQKLLIFTKKLTSSVFPHTQLVGWQRSEYHHWLCFQENFSRKLHRGCSQRYSQGKSAESRA